MKALDEEPMPIQDELDLFLEGLLSVPAIQHFIDDRSCIVPQSNNAEVNIPAPPTQCGILPEIRMVFAGCYRPASPAAIMQLVIF